MMIEAKNINVSFIKENQSRIFGKERQQVLKNVHLELHEGECLGIIGESGSGKSTFGRVLSGLLKPDSGSVTIEGIPLYGRHSKEEKSLLKHQCSVVFQDHTSSVNPRFRVKDIIGESLRIIEKCGRRAVDRNKEVEKLLEQVGLDASYKSRYPHELSGGQLQRVCIARAIALEPKFILFDEAISSLDASTQTQIMDLLVALRKEYKLSYLFITHDLTSVTYLCDRVMFLHNGEIVEEVGHIADLAHVQNDYARKLLTSVIGIDFESKCECKKESA